MKNITTYVIPGCVLFALTLYFMGFVSEEGLGNLLRYILFFFLGLWLWKKHNRKKQKNEENQQENKSEGEKQK